MAKNSSTVATVTAAVALLAGGRNVPRGDTESGGRNAPCGDTESGGRNAPHGDTESGRRNVPRGDTEFCLIGVWNRDLRDSGYLWIDLFETELPGGVLGAGEAIEI